METKTTADIVRNLRELILDAKDLERIEKREKLGLCHVGNNKYKIPRKTLERIGINITKFGVKEFEL